MSLVEKIEDTVVNLLRLAVTKLPKDVKEALEAAYEKENNETAKTQLKAILDNITLAEKTRRPMCQDTGVIIFYVSVGDEFKKIGKLPEIFRNATIRATKEIPLRPNAVHPITQKNSGDNTGRYLPYINWEIIQGDFLEITAFPKGGGSENMSRLGMLKPGEGINGMKKFVVDTVLRAGGQPCPPVILGVGLGGGADIAMKLAKKALLRPITERHPDPEIARLEKELLDAINDSGIGPMGLGGRTTALGVNIEYAHRHPASYPVGVVVQCWAARRASARIYFDGTVEYLTHEVGEG
ncbi:MAG: fumarate hydratase [Candidatus Baldrarchaeia archaeon]